MKRAGRHRQAQAGRDFLRGPRARSDVARGKQLSTLQERVLPQPYTHLPLPERKSREPEFRFTAAMTPSIATKECLCTPCVPRERTATVCTHGNPERAAVLPIELLTKITNGNSDRDRSDATGMIYHAIFKKLYFSKTHESNKFLRNYMYAAACYIYNAIICWKWSICKFTKPFEAGRTWFRHISMHHLPCWLIPAVGSVASHSCPSGCESILSCNELSLCWLLQKRLIIYT